jgi:hypothetical protein
MDNLPRGYKETRFGKICRYYYYYYYKKKKKASVSSHCFFSFFFCSVRSRDNESRTNSFIEKKRIKSAIPPAEFFSEKKEETKPKIAPFCEITSKH